MRCQVEGSGAGRVRSLALALSLACGGQAEDGHASGVSSPDPSRDGTRLSTERPVPAQPEGEASARVATPVVGASGVGDRCGIPEQESGQESVVVGQVELRDDARCGASNSCLLRAREGGACRAGATSFDAACGAAEADGFVPVPPQALPGPSWQEGICTCRCDGSPSARDDCACPRGMRCEALIPSAGVNGAARPYVGSYCVL